MLKYQQQMLQDIFFMFSTEGVTSISGVSLETRGGGEGQGEWTYQQVKQRMGLYSQNSIRVNYLESVLSQIQQKQQSSEEIVHETSNQYVDDSSFSPIVTKHKVIYYVHPRDR